VLLNPFLFRQIKEYFSRGFFANIDRSEVFFVLLEQIKLCRKKNISNYSNIKKFISWYTKGHAYAKAIRKEAVRANSYDEIENIINEFNSRSYNEYIKIDTYSKKL